MAHGKLFQHFVMKGNTMNHMTSWMGTENSVQLIAHIKWEYEHRKLLPNLKHSSVTNHQLYEHSQSLITPRSRILPGKLIGSLLINPVHASHSHVFKIHFNNIIPFMTRYCKWSLSLRSLHQTLYAHLLTPIHAMCTAHLNLHSITRTFGEYRP